VAEAAWTVEPLTRIEDQTAVPRHAAVVRTTHWLTALCFFALLVSGLEIVVSHPRFYWGESGNVLMPPLFSLPIPASRSTVPTGYGFVMPDQNGWSRALHFQAAWLLVLTGALYVIWGAATGHFRRSLLPAASERSLLAMSRAFTHHVKFTRAAAGSDASSYNLVQRIAYLAVIFALFPLIIWTGLAMSPAFVSALPSTVTLLGGRQSARTLHFLVTLALVLFLVIHVAMVWLAGFRARVMPMISGAPASTRGPE
jgi:thiosulfate reductase cytochrome b subunit